MLCLKVPFFFEKKTKTQDHEGRVLLSLYCFFDWQKKRKRKIPLSLGAVFTGENQRLANLRLD